MLVSILGSPGLRKYHPYIYIYMYVKDLGLKVQGLGFKYSRLG